MNANKQADRIKEVCFARDQLTNIYMSERVAVRFRALLLLACNSVVRVVHTRRTFYYTALSLHFTSLLPFLSLPFLQALLYAVWTTYGPIRLHTYEALGPNLCLSYDLLCSLISLEALSKRRERPDLQRVTTDRVFEKAIGADWLVAFQPLHETRASQTLVTLGVTLETQLEAGCFN